MTRRRWAVAGAVVAGLALAAWVAHLYDEAGRGGFERAVAELRADGYATTFHEWNEERIPDSENGAVDFDAADAWLLEKFGKGMEWKGAGPWSHDVEDPWWRNATPERLAETRAFLTELSPYFARIETGLAKPRLRWPRREAPQGGSTSEVVTALQRFGRLADARARTGPPDEVLRSIRQELTIAHRVEGASLIEGMVACALAGAGVRQLRDAVASGHVDATEARERLEPHLRSAFAARLPDFARGELVETVSMVRALQDGRASESISGIETELDAFRFRLGSLFSGGPADMLGTIRRAAAIDAPTHAERARLYAELESGASPAARVFAGIFPGLERKLTRTDAVAALARVALAVKAHRERTGSWPAALDDVRGAFDDGAVPQDPMNDAPLVYETDETSVRVSSAWPAGEGMGEDLAESGLLWEFPR